MEKETFNEKRQQKEEMKSGILCTTLQNNTGKVIFEDNNLCCQFLNDYVDLPHFKDVRPEDIEDVSEEFVPLFSNEREADRIKEIKIRGENNITSFFLISLIEHKSNVEYNIHMQIFRYMVYIWERYERRMEQEKPGCTRRKDFTYPPIIPIVYYEGKGRWTAPKEFKDKIMFGETFKEFLPNFSYYIVPVHDYSNETLLEHGDEISLVMLTNKLQTIDDVEQFRSLPAKKVEKILKDTPDYLLDIIANVLRAFLRRENVPEEETETLVGKVKEKKMGELFANMDKMDIQAERRKTAEAVKKAEEAEKKAAEAVEEAEKKAEKIAEKIAEEAYVIGMMKGIIKSCKSLNASREYALSQPLSG